jgi:hypothetical protein
MEMPDNLLSPTEVEAEFHALSGADWKRAMSLARLCAAGLADWTPENLLAEALVTLKLAMRSIASNQRKKAENGPIDQHSTVEVGAGATDEDALPSVQPEDHRTPESIVDARNQLEYILNLVAGDQDVESVLTAWSLGLRGKEAAQELGFEMKRYEAARKRLDTRLAPAVALRTQS